jgi:hypothetical protein
VQLFEVSAVSSWSAGIWPVPTIPRFPAAGCGLIYRLTAILKAMGAQSIPLIVYRHAQSGAYGIHAGSLDTQQLAALLGL